MEMLMEHHETTKHFVDALSLMTVLGTLMSILPTIAAVWSIVWTSIRIYETKTVQGWLGKNKESE